MNYVGLDLGKRQDPSAFAVLTRADAAHAWMRLPDDRLGCGFLQRLALGTPFPMVVRRLQEIVYKLNSNCSVAVDATGLGDPVVDFLRELQLPCEVTAVSITAGGQERRGHGVVYVPKQNLIAGLQVALQQGELRIAKGLKELGPLVREFVDMRATLTRGGRVRLGADGCGEHDDLVMALALANWQARRRPIGAVGHRLPGI